MSYQARKERLQKKKLKKRNKKADDRYAGVLVTAENRNKLIEEYSNSYYEMYKKQFDEETRQMEEMGDELPEDYSRRFPEITEDELLDQSMEYGRDIIRRKNKELKAYINGHKFYRWKGQTMPVMTQNYIIQNEKIQEANRKKQEEMMKAQLEEKTGLDFEAEGVNIEMKKVEATEISIASQNIIEEE